MTGDIRETFIITTVAAAYTLANELKTDYEVHRASAVYHSAADTTNTISASNASTTATLIALVNELKTDFNAHVILSTAHIDVTGKLITAHHATSLATSYVLLDNIKSIYNQHIPSIKYHLSADTSNAITSPSSTVSSINKDFNANGGSVLVELTGSSFDGTVDFKTTPDGSTFYNIPYINRATITPTPTVAQISSPSTAAIYMLLGPLSQVRIAVGAGTTGSLTVVYRTIESTDLQVAYLAAGELKIGAVGLQTASGDEVTDDTADAVKVTQVDSSGVNMTDTVVVASRVLPTWTFGAPTLHISGNGKANWERGEAVLSTHQKGGNGWVARLYGGLQSTWDDAAEVYVATHELPVTSLSSCLYSWFQTNAEEFGLEMVIWMHDPTDFNKRAEATLSYLDTEKGSGWDAHELASTNRFIYYGENVGSPDTCPSEATNYTWAQYQADSVFSTWTIYRISFANGYYTGDGVFEDYFMADLMINGTVVPMGPKDGKHRKTVKDTKTLLNTLKAAGDVFSNAVSTNGTAWSWSFGGTGYITKARITHSTGLTPRVRLHLWDFIITDSEAEMDDSDAFNGPVAASDDYYIGYIDFPSWSSSGTGLSQSIVTPNTIGNLPLEFNEHVLYGVTETLDAFTPTAAACNIYLTADMEDN